MELKEAVALLEADRIGQAEFYTREGTREIPEWLLCRVDTLLNWIKFRIDGDCPDVEAYEREAAKVVRKYIQDQVDSLVDSLAKDLVQ